MDRAVDHVGVKFNRVLGKVSGAAHPKAAHQFFYCGGSEPPASAEQLLSAVSDFCIFHQCVSEFPSDNIVWLGHKHPVLSHLLNIYRTENELPEN